MMRICCCTSWGWAGPPGASQCRIACANVDDEVYAIQAGVQDAHLILYNMGDIINDDTFEDLPRIIACPTCATTYSLKLDSIPALP